MPSRTLTAATRFGRLHKQQYFSDSCTLTGTGILVGDTVSVTGTDGTTKTRWVGTVMADNGDGTFDSSDLHVRQLQVGGGNGDQEDVDVTVTNQDDSTDISAKKRTANVSVIR
jgi:hypothetical protein